MQDNKQQQFCRISLSTLLEQAYECEIRVVGAIKQIFQHKQYIVEVYIKKLLVLRSLKRYSQFQALDQVIRMNFKNIDLNIGEFPSKFQVLNRQQSRRSYFQAMLNKIIHIYCEKITNETNRRLLSTFYVFLAGSQAKKNIKKMVGSKSENDSVDSGLNSFQAEDARREKLIEDFMAAQNQKEGVKKNSLKMINNSDKKVAQQQMTEQSKFRELISTQFLIKFQDECQWKQRYLKIQNSCLLIYKHKHQNNFKSKIELYQAKVQFLHRQKNILDHFCEKMELDNQPTFREDESVVAVWHQYDYKKMLVKVKEGEKMELKLVKELLRKASHQTTVSDYIEGVFSPIGKIFIVLHKLLFEGGSKKIAPILYVRIRTSGLQYETKRMTYVNNLLLNIKQGFMIPISNAFANIIIQVILIQNDGIIRHQTQQKCVGRYRLCFSDFISYPQGYGLQKMIALTTTDGETSKYQSRIQMSVMNYSSVSSIYGDSYANQNDGILMSGLKSTSDTDELVITVDRVLRVIGNVALFIQAFWRNVYLFKYPRMGYAFFSFLIVLFLCGSAGTIFQLIITVILGAMVYNIPICNVIIKQLMEEYVFSFKHKSHKQPLTLSNNQLKFLKWRNNLKMIEQDYCMTINGKLQKSQTAKVKKYQYWQFQVHEKVFKVREQLPGLIEKVFEVKKIIQLVLRMISAVINTVQKICNILSWADARRTIIIFGLLFFISTVANFYIIRGIGCLFCTHRLVKGLNFWQKKHYRNNRKLAVYCLRYIINKSFAWLLAKEKRIVSIKQQQIERILDESYFPIRDEEKLKKMKGEIEEILGVYIDNDQLYAMEREDKTKSGIKIIHFVRMIETCQSRLKLQWISGQQGISDDFQQLKRLTQQYLVMDLWIESLLINFVLNIPSQLYTTFRPIRSQQSLKCESAQDQIGSKFIRLKI